MPAGFLQSPAMPSLALALVLAAGLLHATWNLVAKRAGGDLRFAALSSVFMVLLWSPVVAPAALRAVPGWGTAEWACVLGSAAIHVPYYALLLRGYRVADLTVVYPLARGSGPLVTASVAMLAMGEPATPGTLAGIGCIALGVSLIAGLWRALGVFGRAASARDPEARARLHQGLLYGLGTGLTIAGYSLVDAYAIKTLGMPPLLVNAGADFGRTLLFTPLLLGDRSATRTLARAHWRAALVVAVLGPLAYVLVLTALQMAPLSHVAPAREVSMLFAALLGGRLLGEGHRGERLAGAGLMVAGVLMLAWW